MIDRAYEFRSRVRRRLDAGLSQEARSERAGLHRTYIGLLERGLRMPSIYVARQVASALETTVAELLTETQQQLEQLGPLEPE